MFVACLMTGDCSPWTAAASPNLPSVQVHEQWRSQLFGVSFGIVALPRATTPARHADTGWTTAEISLNSFNCLTPGDTQWNTANRVQIPAPLAVAVLRWAEREDIFCGHH